jgi:hypothetical protein
LKSLASSLLLGAACFIAAGLASCGGDDPTPKQAACQVEPIQTFHERIEPLLSEGRVTSCNQCHLSGVDLSAFARATPCETWACLVDQDLVDVASPADSKILGWIERASPDSDLITPEVIGAERDAFRDWIDANAACPDACAGVTCGAAADGPTCAVSDHGAPADGNGGAPAVPGCSDRELEQAFYDDVYSWRGRCFPCHFDTETKADKTAPRWISAVGNCQTGSAVSLKRILGLGLIDLNEPTNSLLLQKPLDAPSARHGGGRKFTTEDEAYLSFLGFISHYRDCRPP